MTNAEYVLLQLALPGKPARNVGVLLLDRKANRLHWRLRADWHALAPPEDAEILALLKQDLASKIQESGGEQFLVALEDQLSNILRLTGRRPIESEDLQAAVHELFRQCCMD